MQNTKQIHPAYSWYTYRFIPRVLSIQTTKFNSKIYLLPRILRIRKDSFCVVSVYRQIHFAHSQYTNNKIWFIDLPQSTYSPYTYRFFPHSLSIRTDPFCVFSVYVCADSLCRFGESAQIISHIWNWIIFFTAFKGTLLQNKYVCVQLDRRLTKYNWLFGPSMTKIYFRVLTKYEEWPSNLNISANSNLY